MKGGKEPASVVAGVGNRGDRVGAESGDLYR